MFLLYLCGVYADILAHILAQPQTNCNIFGLWTELFYNVSRTTYKKLGSLGCAQNFLWLLEGRQGEPPKIRSYKFCANLRTPNFWYVFYYTWEKCIVDKLKILQLVRGPLNIMTGLRVIILQIQGCSLTCTPNSVTGNSHIFYPKRILFNISLRPLSVTLLRVY